MKKLLTLTLAAGLASLVSAVDFRVDISGQGSKIELENKDAKGLRTTTASWLGENKNQRLLYMGPVSGQWEEKSFSFTAKKDGTVGICLMGTVNKEGAPLIAYDDVKVNGKALTNGSFEQTAEKKIPGWGGWGSAKVMTDGGADGKNYVLANHVHALNQNIKVKAGETVTVSLKVKEGK